jgi:hypothetical protein
MYIFEQGNLVEIRYANQKGSYEGAGAFQESFSYTSILNKKSPAEKTAAFINVHPLSGCQVLSIQLASKNLVSKVVDRTSRVYTYQWEVNQAGYVVK